MREVGGSLYLLEMPGFPTGPGRFWLGRASFWRFSRICRNLANGPARPRMSFATDLKTRGPQVAHARGQEILLIPPAFLKFGPPGWLQEPPAFGCCQELFLPEIAISLNLSFLRISPDFWFSHIFSKFSDFSNIMRFLEF